MLMDVKPQAMPTSQEAAPADAPRDGVARGTERSPDENRPAATVAAVSYTHLTLPTILRV